VTASARVLLVEDDRIVRITVRDALSRAGYAVSEHSDGGSALRAVDAEVFDIVLTDVRLPGTDGITLFRHIRQVQPDAAVLLFTAYADVGDAVAVMREGARDYIEKPFEMDELLARIARLREELEFRRGMRSSSGDPRSAEKRVLRGVSAAWRRTVARIEAAADTATTWFTRSAAPSPGRASCPATGTLADGRAAGSRRSSGSGG
jgi:DNA-binding NtrC family response regulator